MNIESAGVMLLLAVLVSMACRRLRIPYTVGLVAAGASLALSPGAQDLALTREMIFGALLPPLIFEAAMQIRWEELRKDFAVVTLLATVGVVLSVAVMGLGMRFLLGFDPSMALILAVLLSATDPVAVIATFKDAGVTGRLRLLVEAESIFNDGTAAVLFGIALAALGGGGLQPAAAAGTFVLTVAGGVGIGLAVALLAIFLAGKTDDHLVEASLTTLAAYASFLIAEHFHLSGVLATLAAGLLLGNMGSLGSFSDKSHELIEFYWEYVAFLANSIIFLLIGLRLAHGEIVPYLGPLGAMIVLGLLGRALAVYLPLAFFARSTSRVDRRHQHVLVWGGLRGALALALVLGIPESAPWRGEAESLTFGVVAFSVVVQGLTVTPLMRKLGLNPSN